MSIWCSAAFARMSICVFWTSALALNCSTWPLTFSASIFGSGLGGGGCFTASISRSQMPSMDDAPRNVANAGLASSSRNGTTCGAAAEIAATSLRYSVRPWRNSIRSCFTASKSVRLSDSASTSTR